MRKRRQRQQQQRPGSAASNNGGQPRLGIPVWGPGTTDEQSRDEMELEDLAVWLSLVNDDEDDDEDELQPF